MVLARLGVRAEASALALATMWLVAADFGVMYTSIALSPALVSSACSGDRAAAAWRRRRICCCPTATALSFAMAVPIIFFMVCFQVGRWFSRFDYSVL